MSYDIPEDGVPFALARAGFEISLIEAALVRTGGNVMRAARVLGMDRTSLVRKMRALGLRGSLKPGHPVKVFTGAD